jgi:HSP20 family protein
MTYYYKNTNNGHVNSWGNLIDSIFNGKSFDNVPAPSNILSDDKHVEIHLQAPGINKEDIDINVKDDALEVSYEGSQEDQSFVQQQIFKDGFYNKFKLSKDLDHKNIEASMNNGILEISIKRKKSSPKSRIKIT